MGAPRAGKGQRMNTRPNPYVGPRSFRTGEKLFGRSRETAELIDLLIAERIVLMSSPSGAGKSSLINAGVIPQMRGHGFNVFPPMRVGRSLPSDVVLPQQGNRFVVSLLLSIEEAQEHRLPVDTLTRMTFEDYLTRCKEMDRSTDSDLLVFDQFEEILTIDPGQRTAKQEFFEQVGRALRNRTRWALFATREEYVAALLPYGRSIPTRFATTFRLDLLSKAAATEAICEPAREAGVAFDREAVESLERFLSLIRVQQPDGTTTEEPGDYIEPVQLQVVCRRLWDTLPADATTISAEHVRTVGQVERALADYYEDVIATAAHVSGGGERAIREWVGNALITPSGIRGEVMQTPKASRGLDNAVIAKLVDGYLVREDKRRGNTWYELAHDRLIEPVKTSNAAWFDKNLHPMQRQAELWEREGKPERLLLRGPDLKAAESWAVANDAFMVDLEKDLLERSAKQRKADRVKRGALIFFVSALAILTVFSLYQRSEAVNQRREAIEQRNAALLTQSRHLSDLAAGQLEAKDAVAEMLVALAGLPDYGPTPRSGSGRPQRPYLPALEGRLYEGYLGNHERIVLSGHKDSVLSAVFSPDGRRIATGSADQSVRVWDAVTGKLLTEITDHDGAVSSVAFTPDGTRIVSGSGDTMMRSFDALTGRMISEFKENTGGILGVAVSADGSRIVSGSDDGTARVWDAGTGRPISLLSGHSGPVNSVSISGDGAVVVTGSGDATARVWNAATGKPSDFVARHMLAISSVALSADAKRFVTGSVDKTIRVWDASTGKLVAPMIDTDQPVSSIAFEAADTHIIAGLGDGTVRVWDAATGLETARMTGHRKAITSVGISPEGTQLVSGSGDGTARIWSMAVGADSVILKHDGSVSAVAISPEGAKVVTASSDKTRIWDGRSGKVVSVLDGHGADVSSVAISPDASLIVTGSSDKTASIWDAMTGKTVRELPGHDGPVISVAISADAQRIATGSEDTTARIWNAKTGTPIATLGPLVGRVTSVAFSPSGDRVATGAGTTARIWDTTTGKQIGNPRRHTLQVLAVAISPDGRLLASGGREPRILIGQLGAKAEPSFLKGHAGAVTSIAFSGDGARIIAGSDNGRLYVWETASGELIDSVRMDSEAILGMAIAAKGARFVMRSNGDTVRISPFFDNTTSLVDQAKNTVPRCLTVAQMNTFHLGAIPPRWCITGSGREQETDSAKWQPRWPYDTPEWRQWLGATDRGEQLAPPEM
jgi:WD40 repeat protein